MIVGLASDHKSGAKFGGMAEKEDCKIDLWITSLVLSDCFSVEF